MNPYAILNVSPMATREEIRTAYRQMARRWHPDRFMAGPERDWANEKMAEINAAYRLCLDSLKDARAAADSEDESLAQVRQLIDDGMYTSARQKLMGLNTRCAEWNYLFGWLLLQSSELDKAIRYLSVAVHQKPDSVKYARALREAERMASTPGRLQQLLGRIRSGTAAE